MIENDLIELITLDKDGNPQFSKIEKLIDRMRLTHDSNLPFVVWEYGLEALIPLVSKKDANTILSNGIEWLNFLGTEKGLDLGMQMIGVKTYRLKFSDERWTRFEIESELGKDNELLSKVVGISRLSSAKRERLIRIFHDYNVPSLKWSSGTSYSHSFYSSSSGINNYKNSGVKVSLGSPEFKERPIGKYFNRFDSVDKINNYTEHRFYNRPAQASEVNEIQSRSRLYLRESLNHIHGKVSILSGGIVEIADNKITISPAKFYIDGAIVHAPVTVLDVTNVTIRSFVSISINKTEVTEKEDPSLSEQDTESESFGLGGATRIKTSISYAITAGNKSYAICEFENGSILSSQTSIDSQNIRVGLNSQFKTLEEAFLVAKQFTSSTILIESSFQVLSPEILQNLSNVSVKFLENSKLTLNKNLKFLNCENIRFIDCNITNPNSGRFNISSVNSKSINFINCRSSGIKFRNFKNIILTNTTLWR